MELHIDIEQIKKSISQNSLANISKFEFHKMLFSTNQYLLDLEDIQSGHIVIAEQQATGRGQRGRPWISPPGNLYLSLYWKFEREINELTGLSLVVGAAVLSALNKLGINELCLKYPNDILFRKSYKLCGILTEMKSDRVVFGIGLNINMPEGTNIDQSWIDLMTIKPELIDYNKITAYLLDSLLEILPDFDAHGLHKFEDDLRMIRCDLPID